MSSTNRGGKKGGGEREFFPTPAYAVHRLLERLSLPGGDWLEAGAGDGAIIRAVRAVRQDVHFTAVEVRPECERDLHEAGAAEVVIGYFRPAAALYATAGRRFKVALFNPPFSQAAAFVQLAMVLCDYVVCLERSPWIGDSEERYQLFHGMMPDEYRVGRVDFDGGGGDSVPYSWFCWGPGERRREAGKLVLLRPTPSEERVRGMLPPARQGLLFAATGGGR